MITSEEIKQIRIRLGVTQEAFAQLVGVSFSTVNRWENELSKPSQLAIGRIEDIKNKLKEKI